jgi:hypothetical protein
VVPQAATAYSVSLADMVSVLFTRCLRLLPGINHACVAAFTSHHRRDQIHPHQKHSQRRAHSVLQVPTLRYSVIEWWSAA